MRYIFIELLFDIYDFGQSNYVFDFDTQTMRVIHWYSDTQPMGIGTEISSILGITSLLCFWTQLMGDIY